MNRFILISVLSLSVFLSGISRSEVVDRIIAIVNDDIITLIELEKYVHVQKHGKFVSVNEYFRNIQLREKMDTVIESLLIKQQAKKMKLDVSDKEVRGVVENIKKQYLITDEGLKEQLKKDNINYNDFIDGLKSNLLRNKVLAQVISPEVLITENILKEYYNKHIDEYREEEYRLRQIFISSKSADPEKKALAALSLLKEGKPFESVAKEFSEDPSGPDGGDIGLIKSEELIPELREAVRVLKPGMYTNIIKTLYGFIILSIIETKKGDTLPFDSVKDRIHERIIQEEGDKRYKDFVDKLRKSSYIEVKI